MSLARIFFSATPIVHMILISNDGKNFAAELSISFYVNIPSVDG